MKVFTITNKEILLGASVVPFVLKRHDPQIDINAIIIGRATKGQRLGILNVRPLREIDPSKEFTIEHACLYQSSSGLPALRQLKYSQPFDTHAVVVFKIFVPFQCSAEYVFAETNAQRICSTTTTKNKDQAIFVIPPTHFSIIIHPPATNQPPLHTRFCAFSQTIRRNFFYDGNSIKELY